MAEMTTAKQSSTNRNKIRIDKAYKSYLEKAHGAEDILFREVLRFAQGKITKALFEIDDAMGNVDDLAQEVALYVWTKMDAFSGEPSMFYPWINRICYLKGVEGYNSVTNSRSLRVPLQLQDEDGLLDDNPELYREQYTQPIRKLPDFIQGVERRICDYMREGFTYAQIAGILEIKESAVKKKVERLKKKVESNKCSK